MLGQIIPFLSFKMIYIEHLGLKGGEPGLQAPL